MDVSVDTKSRVKLPAPYFSDDNPYWQPSPFRRLSLQDYAYAATWESRRFWIDGRIGLIIQSARNKWMLWHLVVWIPFLNWLRENKMRLIKDGKAGMGKGNSCGSGVRTPVASSASAVPDL